MPRALSLLIATALSATTFAAAPAAGDAAPSVPTVQQSEAEAGTRVRPRSVRRPLAAPRTRTAVTPVAVPRTAVAPTEPLTTTPPAVAEPPAIGPHAFLNVEDGAVTRWNPCQPVPWQFNPAGAPVGGFEAVQAAMATLAAKTGLPLQYEGTASTALSASYLQQGWGAFRPLLVGWTTPQESDLLAGGDAGLVGMARILWTGSYGADGRNHTQIASGVVALNRQTQTSTSGAGSWYAFALHELGHAVGLGHVDADTELMRASIPTHLATYGPGDLQGLRAVGSTGGCLPNIR